VLLELARRGELASRIALGEALAEAARREGEVAAAREALRLHREASADDARRAPGPEVWAGGLAGEARHASRRGEEEARLVAALGRREAEHDEARDDTARRRAALGEARAAVRALEARREVWRAARARDRARVEEEAADELVSARWGAAS
jgi:hypothetical protein